MVIFLHVFAIRMFGSLWFRENIMLILHFIAISQTNIKNHKCKYHASDGSLPRLLRRYNPRLLRGSRGVVKQRTHSSFALQSISSFGIHLYENICQIWYSWLVKHNCNTYTSIYSFNVVISLNNFHLFLAVQTSENYRRLRFHQFFNDKQNDH